MDQKARDDPYQRGRRRIKDQETICNSTGPGCAGPTRGRGKPTDQPKITVVLVYQRPLD